MSDIRNRREIELGIDRGIEEAGIDLIEGEYAAGRTCLAPVS